MIEKSQTQMLLGAELRAGDGATVGPITQVHLDDYYDEPEWVTVGTGRSRESFVPAGEARVGDDGVVTVPYSRAQITGAPAVRDPGHLSPSEERKLYDYYEIGYDTEEDGDSADPTPGR